MKLLMLTKLSTTGPDIFAYQGATDAARGSCISRRGAYRTWASMTGLTATARPFAQTMPLPGASRVIRPAE